jgi:hypothetical protein
MCAVEAHLSAGDAAYVDEHYEASVRSYDAALASVAPGNDAPAVLHLHRAAALFKLNRLEDSLADANTALRLARTAGTADAECVSLYRKGYVPPCVEQQ